MALTNGDSDGRIVLRSTSKSSSRVTSAHFFMLNPAVHFGKVVEEARSVLLFGGTMQPVSYWIV